MNIRSVINDKSTNGCFCFSSAHHDTGALPPACVIPHSLEAIAEYFRSDSWLELRAKSFQRDPVCIGCGEEPTIVHHRRWPDVLGEEPISDLTPLCRMCALRIYISFGFCGDCINLLVDGQTPSAQEVRRVHPETDHNWKGGDTIMNQLEKEYPAKAEPKQRKSDDYFGTTLHNYNKEVTMKQRDPDPCDNLRALCWQMLEAHDKRLGLTTGTMQSIEAEGQYEHADDGVKQILCDYGVYLALPIFEEVEQDYRNRFRFTQIPNDAFGTLIEYEEDDLEPEERYEAWRYGTEFREPEIVPLKEYPDWAQAAELSRLQPEIATIIRRLPRLWSLRCRRSGYRCVLMMHDMVEECIQNKEEAVQDSNIPVIRRLREYAWTLLELHDKLEALEPSRPASIEVDEGVQFAKWAIVEFLQVFGVTQARPILQDVRRHYRLRFPYTQIPTNAFETLIEYEENELAPRRTWFDGRIADVSLLFDGRCLRWMNDLASEEAILP